MICLSAYCLLTACLPGNRCQRRFPRHPLRSPSTSGGPAEARGRHQQGPAKKTRTQGYTTHSISINPDKTDIAWHAEQGNSSPTQWSRRTTGTRARSLPAAYTLLSLAVSTCGEAGPDEEALVKELVIRLLVEHGSEMHSDESRQRLKREELK